MQPKYFIAIALILSVADLARSIGHRYDVDDQDEDYDSREREETEEDDEEEGAETEEDDEEEEERREEVRRANVSALLPPTSSPVPFTTSTPQEDQEGILEKAETDAPTTTQTSPTFEPPAEDQSDRQKLTYHSFVRKGLGDERVLKKEKEEDEEDSKYLSRGIGRGSLRDSTTTERSLRRESSRSSPARVSTVAPSRGYAVRETPAEGCNPAINTVADSAEATKPQYDWRRGRMSRRRDTTESTTEAPSRGRWQRGSTRGRTTTTTTTAAPSTAKDWRARAIDRRRGIRSTTTTPATTSTTTEGSLRVESRGSAGKKYTSPPRRGKEKKPKGHYVEYEESELFEDGKPVVKKKRVQKLLDDEEEGNNGTSRASNSPEGDDSAEQPSDPAHRISSSSREKDEDGEEEEEYRLSPSSRQSKKRKNDFHNKDHYDLEKYFHHRDDDEDHYGSHYGHGSESRGVRRKHYDPYQDYFDFVYSITHPHDEHSHHNHHGLHGQPSRHRSHGVEEDSVPEGSSFRKRYYKAWRTSDKDAEDDEGDKRGKRKSRRRRRAEKVRDYWEDEL